MEKPSEKSIKKSIYKRSLLAGIGIVGAAFVAGELILSHYLLQYAVSRSSDSSERKIKKKKKKTDAAEEEFIKSAPARATHDLERAMGQTWHDTIPRTAVTLTSPDGLMLYGELFVQEALKSDRYVLLVHGYKCCSDSMYHYAYHYWQKGYNVLLVDLRACGNSEGDYLGMGWLDRKDILSWIDYLLSLNPDAKIILHGESMGAATVMMVSGEETLPANVRAVIEDSGYTSVYDIFHSEIGLRFGIPSFPLLDLSSKMSQKKASFDFREASALKQVAKSHTPTLFIHGTGDDFVPFSMQEPLYEACAAPKERLVIENAEHCCSAFYENENYYQHIFDFIKKYI